MSDAARDPGATQRMSLGHALEILCRVHLRDHYDDEDSWSVRMGAIPDFTANGVSQQEYVAAWAAVRRATGR